MLNVDIIRDKFVEKLKDYVNSITPCQEVEIGLRIPRRPIRLVMKDYKLDLYQSFTGRTCTKEMEEYSLNFLDFLGNEHYNMLNNAKLVLNEKDIDN